MRRIRSPFIAAPAFVLLAACSGSDEKAAEAASAAAETAPTAQAPAEPAPSPEEQAAQADAELNAKLGKYIGECLNTFNDSITRSHQRYLQWVENAESGPTGRERHVYGTHQVSIEASRCRSAVTEAAAMPPSHPELEAAAETYVASLETVVPRINNVYTYYNREDYKDDDFARGRELHGPLMEALNGFEEAKAPLSSLVRSINRELTERRLSRLEAIPEREAELLVERTMLLAEDMANATDGWTVEDLKLVGIDAEAFARLVENFEAQADKLKTYLETAELETLQKHNIDTFSDKAQELIRISKGLNRRLRDQEPFHRSDLSRFSSGFAVDGSPPQLTRAYNDVVSHYNHLRW